MAYTLDGVSYFLAWVGTGCWAVCFWWMHRISQRQDALLTELREQGERIEQLSKEEHELIKEVHPAVHEIRETVLEVANEAAAIGSSGAGRGSEASAVVH